MIEEHKWARQDGHALIEKFFYTDDGRYFTEYDGIRKHRFGSKDVLHPARILIDKSQGMISVHWSTPDMRKVSAGTLPELRKELKDYLDSVRSGKLVEDVNTWDKVIYWNYDGRPERAVVLLDENKKVVRMATWSEAKQQFDPDNARQSFYGRQVEWEPFTEKRWAEVEALWKLQEEFDHACQQFDRVRHDFKVREKNKVHLDVMRTMTPVLKKVHDRLRKASEARAAARKKAKEQK